MTRHQGERTLAERVAPSAPDPLLIPVWVRDSGRHLPGVLTAWERRNDSWLGLVDLDAGRCRERVWLPAGRLEPIRPR